MSSLRPGADIGTGDAATISLRGTEPMLAIARFFVEPTALQILGETRRKGMLFRLSMPELFKGLVAEWLCRIAPAELSVRTQWSLKLDRSSGRNRLVYSLGAVTVLVSPATDSRRARYQLVDEIETERDRHQSYAYLRHAARRNRSVVRLRRPACRVTGYHYTGHRAYSQRSHPDQRRYRGCRAVVSIGNRAVQNTGD